MTNHSAPRRKASPDLTRSRRVLVAAAALVATGAITARAQGGAVYKDVERYAEPGYAGTVHGPVRLPAGTARPTTRWTGGPGYAGSEYGLGKPSFNGIGSRPDWGRSNQ